MRFSGRIDEGEVYVRQGDYGVDQRVATVRTLCTSFSSLLVTSQSDDDFSLAPQSHAVHTAHPWWQAGEPAAEVGQMGESGFDLPSFS